VSALEGRLLPQRATLDLLQAGSLDEVVTRVRQTLVGDDLPEATTPFEMAEAVQESLVSAVSDVAAASPTPALANLLLLPIEWEAFRAALRAHTTGTEPVAIAGSRIPAAIWEQCWETSDVEEPYGLFAAAAAAIREAMPREKRDHRLIDGITHAYEAQHLNRTVEQVGSETVAGWFRRRLQWRLAMSLVRCRINSWGHIRYAQALEHLGESKQDLLTLVEPERHDWRPPFIALGLAAVQDLDPGDPAAPIALERLIDDATTDLVQGGRGIPYGPEPVAAFLWALRTEALNLKLVLTGLAAGLPADAVAQDIRRTYV